MQDPESSQNSSGLATEKPWSRGQIGAHVLSCGPALKSHGAGEGPRGEHLLASQYLWD